MIAVLAIRGLVKRYRAGILGCSASVEALRGIDLDLDQGELLGLLGPNGAGKSTLLLCAAGLLRPDAGQIAWFGLRSGPARPADVAYVPERSVYYSYLSVHEALAYYAALHEPRSAASRRAVAEVMERVGLAANADTRVAHLSHGLQQRLGLAQALIGRPRLLLLDETLAGLDPLSRRDVRELLRALPEVGTTVVLSSHDLDALEQLATRIVVLRDGRVCAAIDPGAITRRPLLELQVDAPERAERLLVEARLTVQRLGDSLRIPLEGVSPDEVLERCRTLAIGVDGARLLRDDLEQRFFDLIGRADYPERPSRVAEGEP